MEYLIIAGLTAVVVGLIYAVVKQKQQEHIEWKKRRARKAQIKKAK